MPRPYSTDLRERVLAAYEGGEGSQAQVARRYRVGERTLSGRLRAARGEGRRGPKPHGGGRVPVGGASEVLAALVAERNDATPAEYADLLDGRAGVRRSPAAVCRALKTLGLVRKKRRFGPPNRIARTWPRRGGRGAPTSPGSIPDGWSSSTRPGSTRHPDDPTPCPRARRAAGAHRARCRGVAGNG